MRDTLASFVRIFLNYEFYIDSGLGRLLSGFHRTRLKFGFLIDVWMKLWNISRKKCHFSVVFTVFVNVNLPLVFTRYVDVVLHYVEDWAIIKGNVNLEYHYLLCDLYKVPFSFLFKSDHIFSKKKLTINFEIVMHHISYIMLTNNEPLNSMSKFKHIFSFSVRCKSNKFKFRFTNYFVKYDVTKPSKTQTFFNICYEIFSSYG